MPNKYNAARRHHISKMKFKARNWAEYDVGFRRRGSLMLWVTLELRDGGRLPVGPPLVGIPRGPGAFEFQGLTMFRNSAHAGSPGSTGKLFGAELALECVTAIFSRSLKGDDQMAEHGLAAVQGLRKFARADASLVGCVDRPGAIQIVQSVPLIALQEPIAYRVDRAGLHRADQ